MTALEVPYRADIRRYSKHRLSDWVRPLTIGLLLVAVLAGAGARIGYAATYQPLDFSGTFGPVTTQGWKSVSDGFAVTRMLLVAKTGTTATYEYGVQNQGDYPVTLYDVPDDPQNWIYTSLAWRPFQDYEGDGQKLPVVIKPHQIVELLFSVRKPACAPNTAETSIQGLVVHYRVFGFDHTLESPSGGGDLFPPIMLCWDPR